MRQNKLPEEHLLKNPLFPLLSHPHPILTGLSSFPQLTGYVATTPKAAAQIVLASQLDDPVLAVWQYGLGRVVAWTSDALGLWTANWLQWSDAARWWANLVTWTISTPNNQLIVNNGIQSRGMDILSSISLLKLQPYLEFSKSATSPGQNHCS